MSGIDLWGEIEGSDWDYYTRKSESKSRRKNTSKRTTQYVGPGHTRVRYAKRTLDIRFKETPAQFKAKQRLRRSKGAKKGAKNRTPRSRDDTIYVDIVNGQMVYVDSRGRDVSMKARGYADKGQDAMIGKNMKKDKYNIEEMRALLKDAHWEDYAGNKRWSYDGKETVRQFKKYQKHIKGMR